MGLVSSACSEVDRVVLFHMRSCFATYNFILKKQFDFERHGMPVKIATLPSNLNKD